MIKFDSKDSQIPKTQSGIEPVLRETICPTEIKDKDLKHLYCISARVGIIKAGHVVSLIGYDIPQFSFIGMKVGSVDGV